jgi:UDP-N-acetylmuramyl pentapeptide phosphotransferase/UDP-N-acetylglucosamine-1-phosphate transferase
MGSIVDFLGSVMCGLGALFFTTVALSLTVNGSPSSVYVWAFALLCGVMSWSGFRDQRIERQKRQRKAMQLGGLLQLGIPVSEAVSTVLKSYKSARPVRYYHQDKRTGWVEIDTSEATFVLHTQNGRICNWSSK